MRPFFVAAALAVALLSFAPRARAQVNTEPLRSRIRARGFSGLVELSIIGRTGNTEGIAYDPDGGFGFAGGRELAYVFGSADYSRFNGATQVAKYFAHARYNHEIETWLVGEAFVQVQSDEFQRLKLRNLVGVGPRFHVVEGDAPAIDAHGNVWAGVAYMLERDVINVAPGAPDERTPVEHRLSTYVTAHVDFDTRVTFATTMYYQPLLTYPKDTRLLSETSFVFKVNKILSAALSGTVRYDSETPTDVKSLDTEIKNSLALTF